MVGTQIMLYINQYSMYTVSYRSMSYYRKSIACSVTYNRRLDYINFFRKLMGPTELCRIVYSSLK